MDDKTESLSIPGDDLLNLSQLIPDPDYFDISVRIRENGHSSAIERMLREISRGSVKVCRENRSFVVPPTKVLQLKAHNGHTSLIVQGEVPVVRVQVLPPGLGGIIKHLISFGQTKKDYRLISIGQEEILRHFFSDIGFSKQSDIYEENGLIEAHTFTLP